MSPGSSEKRKAYMREYYRKYRRERKARGICIHCGLPAENSRSRCRICLDKIKVHEYERKEKDAAK